MTMCYYDDPILRKKAEEIGQVTDEIKELATTLIDKMLELNGLGLAAPQIGVSKRIFVICLDREDEEGELHLGAPRVFIDPVLSNPSRERVERSEGCLSIPGLTAPVLRPLTIDVEATDLEGNRFTIKKCWGFLARVLMHENDHLNGILFIDRIKGKRRAQLDPMLRKIKIECKR